MEYHNIPKATHTIQIQRGFLVGNRIINLFVSVASYPGQTPKFLTAPESSLMPLFSCGRHFMADNMGSNPCEVDHEFSQSFGGISIFKDPAISCLQRIREYPIWNEQGRQSRKGEATLRNKLRYPIMWSPLRADILLVGSQGFPNYVNISGAFRGWKQYATSRSVAQRHSCCRLKTKTNCLTIYI